MVWKEHRQSRCRPPRPGDKLDLAHLRAHISTGGIQDRVPTMAGKPAVFTTLMSKSSLGKPNLLHGIGRLAGIPQKIPLYDHYPATSMPRKYMAENHQLSESRANAAIAEVENTQNRQHLELLLARPLLDSTTRFGSA